MNEAIDDYSGKIAPINTVLAGSSLRFVHRRHGTDLVRWPTKCRLRRSAPLTLPLNRHHVAQLGLPPRLPQIWRVSVSIPSARSVLVVPIRLNTGTPQIGTLGSQITFYMWKRNKARRRGSTREGTSQPNIARCIHEDQIHDIIGYGRT